MKLKFDQNDIEKLINQILDASIQSKQEIRDKWANMPSQGAKVLYLCSQIDISSARTMELLERKKKANEININIKSRNNHSCTENDNLISGDIIFGKSEKEELISLLNTRLDLFKSLSEKMAAFNIAISAGFLSDFYSNQNIISGFDKEIADNNDENWNSHLFDEIVSEILQGKITGNASDVLLEEHLRNIIKNELMDEN